MKITITIEDSQNGHIRVSEQREPGAGEEDGSVTSASALADAMFELMDQLGEVD